jgi:excinuclease ABC subunit C
MNDPSTLPADAGCYLFRDDHGTVIYIGKAKNLKKRVSTYFQKTDHDPKTMCMLEHIASVDVLVTNSEVEALLLENSLIKQYQPKYNINLKDSKNFAYIQLTDEAFPRIGIARRRKGKAKFFGPFVSARERDDVLAVLKKTFGLRSCRRLPKRACLRYHIGSCSAPCIGKISQGEYQERVQRAEEVLKGKGQELILALREEMEKKADALEYEKAMELRDQIQGLEGLARRQHVTRTVRHNEDIIHYLVVEGEVYLLIFNILRGTLGDKQEFVFEYSPDFFEEFLIQYYADNPVPSELIVPHVIDPSVQEYLSLQKGSAVNVTVPQRGAKKTLLELVRKNIEIGFFGETLKLNELKRQLGLPEVPAVIECFDISHLSGTSTVGSMVQFRHGRPDKRNYRRFRIRSVEGIDDFAAIAEVVKRRYARLQKEGGQLPDLIIVDGGRGQLSSALSVLKEVGVRIPVIAIAKREEEIYVPGRLHPLPLDKSDKASLFIQEIRDEAHRFALAYNRLLRRKEIIG